MRNRALPLLGFVLLAVAALWLRWPGLGFAVWNLDEAIHSAAAHTLLDGGVLYRDAIDQRTPLTYYLVAAVYAIAGQNNLFALHVVVALLVAGTAWLVWLAARAWIPGQAGIWAAGLFVTLATCLPYVGDANAFNTEWTLGFFTALAAAIFARGGSQPSARRLCATGGALGLAFLSKQPALLDAAVPVLALLHLAWRRPEERRGLAVRLACVVAGFAIPVLVAAAYFAAHGALGDAVYYTWTYNLAVYGPEISTADRMFGLAHFTRLFLHGAPLVLAALLLALPLAAAQLVQRTPDARERREEPFLLYAVAWSATATAAALSGGRAFDHYFLQALPPLCLLAGWLLARLGEIALAPPRRSPLARGISVVVVLAVILTVGNSARLARGRTLPTDVSHRVAQFVRANSAPDDRIFVWGFHPEFHLFADRAPASRFLYGSFLTGLVPWTNTAPERDTAYAIVPGAMTTLLSDLAQTQPLFLIDCSAGPNRSWQKYPLDRFPALRDFVAANYVRLVPGEWQGTGFDLYLRRDAARRSSIVLDGAEPAELDAPTWQGPDMTPPAAALITVQGRSANGRLRRLELLVNGEVAAGATFAATEWARMEFRLPFDRLGLGRHELRARATGSDGAARDGENRIVHVTEEFLRPEKLAPFALPRATEPITPQAIEAPFGADAGLNEGRLEFFVHAPSRLTYALPENVTRLRGGFGLRTAAYAPGIAAPTDGAEFRIELLVPDRPPRVLFQRELDPLHRETDRGVQSLDLDLTGLPAPGARLALVITAGPSGSAATDWSYWSDLRLETSH